MAWEENLPASKPIKPWSSDTTMAVCKTIYTLQLVLTDLAKILFGSTNAMWNTLHHKKKTAEGEEDVRRKKKKHQKANVPCNSLIFSFNLFWIL